MDHVRGKRSFSAPLDLSRLTPFQRLVLKKALKIHLGEVRSYRWVAKEIGAERAARAVGTALARNPIPFLIPCHRAGGASRSGMRSLSRRSRTQHAKDIAPAGSAAPPSPNPKLAGLWISAYPAGGAVSGRPRRPQQKGPTGGWVERGRRGLITATGPAGPTTHHTGYLRIGARSAGVNTQYAHGGLTSRGATTDEDLAGSLVPGPGGLLR